MRLTNDDGYGLGFITGWCIGAALMGGVALLEGGDRLPASCPAPPPVPRAESCYPGEVEGVRWQVIGDDRWWVECWPPERDERTADAHHH